VNRPFTYRIVATKVPRSFAAENLPAGLTIAPATGLIRGTPTTAGTYYVRLIATNRAGQGVATLVLNVGIETKPELTAEITGLTAVATRTGGLSVSGFGKISNSGTRAATNFRAQMYVSDDAVFDSGDTLLSRVVAVPLVPPQFRGGAVPVLQKGVSIGPRGFRFTVVPARLSQVQGKYLLLVVDVSARANEFDESNNVGSAGPVSVAP
jgi:hypothetical protein